MTGVIKVDDIQDAGANSIVSSNGSGTLTLGSFTAPNITASTAILPDASDGAAIGSASLEWSDIFLADGAVINLGDDQDVTLTHVADTGIQLNSTNKLMFNDASQYIQGASATVLDIAATDEIELTATLVDINANVEISGTAVTTGVHTFTAVPVFPNNTIETADIQADAITAAKIADNAVVTAGINADAITAAKIADDAISEEHLDVTAITGHTAETSVADGDLVVIHDASASALRKMTKANFVGSTGKIGQVVQGHLNTIATISANSFQPTGLTLNITPSASSSKIYLMATVSLGIGTADYNQGLAFFRDSTQIGSAADVSAREGVQSMTRGLTTSGYSNSSLVFLDSPSSTSQITYTVKLFGENGAAHYINRTGQDADQAHKHRSASTIIAMEVLA